jgi:hypothetical protein
MDNKCLVIPQYGCSVADLYHEDRIHDSLGKDTPYGRAVETKPSPQATVISSVRLGGLHHRYHWQEAA